MSEGKLLNYILLGTVAVNMIAIIAMIYVIFALSSSSATHQHREVVFPQIIEKLRSQPAEKARTNSLTLLEDSNRLLNASANLINQLTRFSLSNAAINIGVLTFCIYKLRRKPLRT